MKLSLNIEIPDERVSDLLCSALEGGSTYWARITATKHGRFVEWKFCHELPFTENGALIFSTLENDEINNRTCWELDRAACHKGLQMMAEKYPHHFSCFLTENDDAETGDVFLQCALFGEVVFG